MIGSAALAAVLLGGCGSSGSRQHTAISGYAYHPVTLTVAAGTAVTFTNDDATAHTATSMSTSPPFDTGTLKPGQSKTITLSKSGTYAYYCQFHPFMRGTITVR
jgi:plastocyanin